MGSQTVVLSNGNEEHVLGVGTYKLRLRGGNTLLPHDAIYPLSMRVCLLCLVSLMKLGFFFNSHIDDLDILYSSNVFGHSTLKNDFLVLDLDDIIKIIHHMPFVSYFDSNSYSVIWNARLGHIEQNRMSRPAKGLLD